MCWKRLVGSQLEIFQGRNVEGVVRKISSYNSIRFFGSDCRCIKTNAKEEGITICRIRCNYESQSRKVKGRIKEQQQQKQQSKNSYILGKQSTVVWEIFLIILPFGDAEHSVALKPGNQLVWITNPVKSGEESPGVLKKDTWVTLDVGSHVIFAESLRQICIFERSVLLSSVKLPEG